MYAIVDIETTGGHADQNGITEIAIFIHDGQKVIDSYSTLVNPEMPIPAFLESYTGITNQMVANAPTFNDISDKVYELLNNNIFVAHNVNFDYTFIRHHLHLSGVAFQSKKLCTVRLSRKLFPGLPSYSLGNLCTSLQIPLQNRHRAFGDAAATVEVFNRILQNDQSTDIIDNFLKRGSKEATLPPNLPKEEFEQLPDTPGVYYFLDDSGKIIYVGKALNLRKRVLSHFSGNKISEKRQNFLREIYHLTFEPTGSEFQALLLESVEIKKHWPKFNKAQKNLEFNYAVYDYEDQNGYLRLAIDRVRKNIKPLHTYRRLADAFNHLQKLVIEFNLCPKLCMINTYKEPCSALQAGCCAGACELNETSENYNARVYLAMNELLRKESYAIVDAGLQPNEVCCILVDNGRFHGMAYIERNQVIYELETLRNLIKPQKDNFFIQELVKPERIPTRNLIYFSQ